MKKKILVAVDGSVYSSNSLDYLIRLFRQDQNFSIDLLAHADVIIFSDSGKSQNCFPKISVLNKINIASERGLFVFWG